MGAPTLTQLNTVKSGHVNLMEFANATVNILGLTIPQEYQEDLFNFFDTDRSGYIDFNSFMSTIRMGKLPEFVNTQASREHEVI